MIASLSTILIVAPIVLGIFVLAYTFVMLQLNNKERAFVEAGKRDFEIIKQHNQKNNAILKEKLASFIHGGLLALLAVIVFIMIYGTINSNGFAFFGNQIRIVGSNSMASVNEVNKSYIAKNDLDGLFSTNDLIILSALPKEEDLKPYDVVAYKTSSGAVIVHRIIEIRQTAVGKAYILRGDANSASDPAIGYSDMYAIYSGKIPLLGAFARFVQSAFGMIAIIFCVYICIADEFLTSSLKKADQKRLKLLLDELQKQVEEKKEQERLAEVEPEMPSNTCKKITKQSKPKPQKAKKISVTLSKSGDAKGKKIKIKCIKTIRQEKPKCIAISSSKTK